MSSNTTPNMRPKPRSDEVFTTSSRAWNSWAPKYLSFLCCVLMSGSGPSRRDARVTFVAYHFGYLLRHLLNRLINLRLVTGGASLPGASRDPPLTNAITGIGGCCARVASGHAAAEVHPSEVRADAGRTETAEELGAFGKDRSGQNAQSNRRDSAQAGATAAETFRCHAFKSNRQKECVQMPGKMARSDPRPSVRVTRGVGSGQHLASVLQEGRENANIDAGLGFIWRISVHCSKCKVCLMELWQATLRRETIARPAAVKHPLATDDWRLRMTVLDDTSFRNRLTVTDVVRLARTIYSDAHGGIKYKQILRPYVCPFHILVDLIPLEANILDVGCGAGLFILVLARLGRIQSAVGFDADQLAIQVAQGAAQKLPKSERIRFEHRDAAEIWPAGRFDVVCLIDVMHHLRPEQQAELLMTAAEHVADNGILLYKDMARRPHWRAWANRLHDLLSVGEWIYYAKLDDVISWGRRKGLRVDRTGSIDMLWYRHEWCILRRWNEKT